MSDDQKIKRTNYIKITTYSDARKKNLLQQHTVNNYFSKLTHAIIQNKTEVISEYRC